MLVQKISMVIATILFVASVGMITSADHTSHTDFIAVYLILLAIFFVATGIWFKPARSQS